MSSGLYKISCVANDYFYIGQSQSMTLRKRTHWSALRGGYHKNSRLQNCWNKYGEPSFLFETIQECNIDELCIEEQRLLDLYFDLPNCMNLSNCSEVSMRGFKHSAETKAKISAANRGIKRGRPSATHRKRLSESNLGKKRSLETRERISKAQTKPIQAISISGEKLLFPSRTELAKHFGCNIKTVDRYMQRATPTKPTSIFHQWHISYTSEV